MKKIKVYLSAVVYGYHGEHILSGDGDELIKLLESSDFDLMYMKEHTSYEDIEDKIEQSDCLLAIVDDNWTSSTWRASEVTFAGGGWAATSDRKIKKPIPVFLFPSPKDVKMGFLTNYKGPIMLSQDPEKAFEEMKQFILKTK